eukprot:gene5970-7436_t
MDDVTPASGAWRKHALITGKRFKKNLISFEKLNDRTIDNITCATSHNLASQIVISDTTTNRDVCRIIKVSKDAKKSSTGTTTGGASGSNVQLSVIKEFIQESSIKSLSWHDNAMVCGSVDGQIYFYNNDPNSNADPDLRETYTITKLKGLKEGVMSAGRTVSGGGGISTWIKSVAINPLSPTNFGCLENSFYHIWDASDAVKPTVSFRVSDVSATASAWSPHSRHYTCIGSADRTLRITDTRLMSSFYSTKKNPVVWSSFGINTQSSLSSLNQSRPTQKHVAIKDIAWHPFVPYWFACGSDDGEISVWDLRSTPSPVLTYSAHAGPVSRINWCPQHSELLVSSGADGEYKMWNLLNEPHYTLFQLDETYPFIDTGFFENDSYNSYGVNQSGEVIYSNITPKFMNPVIHSKFEIKETLERKAESMIYNRDFTNGFEKAIQLANKHTRLSNLEKAKNLLSLCFQTTLEDSLSDVLKSTLPKVNIRDEFLRNLESYSYYIPPSYYEKYGTKLSTGLMTKIKDLKINLDIQYHIKNASGEEILDIERDILTTLRGDHSSIKLETIVDLIEVLMKYDTTKCFNFAIQIVEIFKNKLVFCTPIIRLLLHPTIFEKVPTSGTGSLGDSTIIHQSTLLTPSLGVSPMPSPMPSPSLNKRGDLTSSSSSIPASKQKSEGSSPKLSRSSSLLFDSTPQDIRLAEYLGTPDLIVQQLTFMRDFLKILTSPTPISDGSNPDTEDIIDFSSKNRPSPILSMSINKIYLQILSDMFIYDQFYIVLLNLIELTNGFEFKEYLEELYHTFTPDFISFIKNSQQRDRSKPWDIERYSMPLLTAVSILYNVNNSSIPAELLECLSQSIPVFIEEIDNSLSSIIQQPDPTIELSGKLQSSQKAQGLFDLIKTITDHKQQNVMNRAQKTASLSLSPQQTKVSMELQMKIQNLFSILNKYM